MKKLDVNFDSLKIDFTKVQPNEPGSWPILLKIIAWIAVACVVVIGSNSFYLEGKKGELQKAVSEEADLKQDFQKKAFDAKNLPELRKQMEEATKTLGALLKQLPSQTEVPALLEDITKTGNGSGLEFSEIKIQPEKKVQFYVELPISITVKGGYHDFATFVSGISSLPRIVSLHDFTIKAKSEKDTTLIMQVLAKTYRADSVDVGLDSDTSAKKTDSKSDNSKEGAQ